MTAKRYYKIFLLILTSLVVYYIIVAGFNLIFKLAVPNRPECKPLFCLEIVKENNNCLIKTPGFPECIDVEGYFYVLSASLSYSLLSLCIGLSFYFSRRFYLTRIFSVLLILAAIILVIRIILGAVELSLSGALIEFNKLGLNQPFIQQFGETLFQMVNPKF